MPKSREWSHPVARIMRERCFFSFFFLPFFFFVREVVEDPDVAWALAAARERLLPPATTDNATVADVAAFLDRLADHARAVPYAPRDVATALWACAKIAEAVEGCVEINQ